MELLQRFTWRALPSPPVSSPSMGWERIKMRVIIKKNYSHSNMARHKWGGFKDSLGFWVSNTDNLLRFE